MQNNNLFSPLIQRGLFWKTFLLALCFLRLKTSKIHPRFSFLATEVTRTGSVTFQTGKTAAKRNFLKKSSPELLLQPRQSHNEWIFQVPKELPVAWFWLQAVCCKEVFHVQGRCTRKAPPPHKKCLPLCCPLLAWIRNRFKAGAGGVLGALKQTETKLASRQIVRAVYNIWETSCTFQTAGGGPVPYFFLKDSGGIQKITEC